MPIALLHQQDDEINANIAFSDLGVDRYRLMRLEKELRNNLSLFQCKLFRVAIEGLHSAKTAAIEQE
jgi:hypothetical protein